MDATVIELAADGHALSAANVLQSPQYPNGRIVPLDANLSTDQVRWRFWDDTQWDANGGRGTDDVIAGENQHAPIDFMSPYPASVLKLMVGFGVMQLVDKGEIKLDDPYSYVRAGTTGSACGTNVTKPIRQFFDEMITVSKNESTCALIKLLWDHNAVSGLNQQFVDLGLPYLRLVGTNPQNGGTWGGSNMNSLDTAKLLMILNGAAGRLWTAPNGSPVTKALLTDSSRQFFLSELGQNALSQVLSTTVWCGRAYPAPGIPAKLADRWVNPTNGTVTADGRVYGQDVRPCNAAAQVTYAHKTGFVDTSGQDAGIVQNLPGKASRHFIVVVHTNLGTRYIDVNRPADPPGIYPVVYTEKFGLLGKAIDQLVTNHHNS
ncbi:serine hydrolase [Fodinicola feengrottensis]|uniref:serine hydrolase n=1 Tax=Fodinicola feengrottensis TaxID=435914 RepID=UPI0024430759|nr:serine hydrolase [Fodinicola feengrottensis]